MLHYAIQQTLHAFIERISLLQLTGLIILGRCGYLVLITFGFSRSRNCGSDMELLAFSPLASVYIQDLLLSRLRNFHAHIVL